ncbi:hypothetical protein CMI47_01290 [Candidatus Pacearchaeota archaeon]|nr:hypothetical protein [Candidatus Pacearchaeota archaeon]|tara:strand:+ start:2805 stop:3332 length:528 start_codon:yes stop_codon:yes gene_type:complete
MNKRGQIWIETVLYTLIGLALIGLVLAFIMPKINESRDRAVVDQTLSALDEFDKKVRDVLDKGEGNKRVIDFGMKTGELFINATGDEIFMKLAEQEEAYSEPGVEIDGLGNVKTNTTEGQSGYSVELRVSYGGIANITYAGEDVEKKFNPVSVPYRFSIENKGASVINIEEVSGQ